MMKRIRNYRVMRPVASVLGTVLTLLCVAPPAAAFPSWRQKQALKHFRTQTPKAELQQKIRARKDAERNKPRPEAEPLSSAEMERLHGAGDLRNRHFSGVPPWQRSFRDVNLCTGNLFKSFTDIQVPGARGAGLAWQRTYNSNDDRVGPFGIGWTHAYDICMEEAGSNNVERTDFFGGKHTYHRDADGLYTPPAYLFDELDSKYSDFLVNGPADVLEDTQTAMDGMKKHFFKNGDERACDWIEDRHGNRIELTYALTVTVGGVSKGLLTQVTDASSRSLDVSWTNLGTTQNPVWRITQVQGPYDGNSNPVYVVEYQYNNDGNLWKVIQDPGTGTHLNRTTTFTYTSYSGNGHSETGLLASISDPLSHTVSYTYSLPNPNPTSTLWVSSVTEPGSGGSLTWNLGVVIDGLNRGFHAYAQAPNGLTAGVDTDWYLRVTAVTNSEGFQGSIGYAFEYDDQNNVVRRQAYGDVSPEDFGDNTPVYVQRTVYTYGPHGNLLTSYPEGHTDQITTYTYWNASKCFNKATVTDPLGHVTSMDYYERDDSNPGNRGQLKWIRDARYGTTGEQFEYTYNSYGQRSSETNLNNVVTEYTYGDTWGNLTQVVQDPGMGHLNRTNSIQYDVAGRVTQSTDPMSQSSSFSFNAVGQPLQSTLPDETVTYTYGDNGRTATVTGDRGTTTISYESGNDRVASVTDPVTGAISYTYTATGERATMTLPGNATWTYSYVWLFNNNNVLYSGNAMLPKDDLNSATLRPLSVTDDQGREVDYSLLRTGQLRAVRNNYTLDSNGSPTSYCQTDYIFDSYRDQAAEQDVTRYQLDTIKNRFYSKNQMGQWTNTVLVQNDYTYNDDGNRTANQLSDSGGVIRTEQYGYDGAHRLTSVNYGDGTTQTYVFDPMGNRTSKYDSNSGTESYTYNNANMLLSRGSNNYTYDANGNTLTGGGRSNTWDGENRLTQCVYNSTTTSHTYGADGLRRRMVQGNNTTDFLFDGQSVVRTVLNSSVDRTYLQGARGAEYERIGSNAPVWYLCDGLGSVLGTVNSSGTVVSTRKYDVYGAVRASTGPSGTKHKFAGSLGHPSEDDTGLIYMRARHYDPIAGRFFSEDPSRVGPNWYSYCSNNPINQIDASGRNPILISVLIAMAAVFVAGALVSIRDDYINGRSIDWGKALDAAYIGAGIGLLGAIVWPSGVAVGAEILAAFVSVGAGLVGFAPLLLSAAAFGIALVSVVAAVVVVSAVIAGLAYAMEHDGPGTDPMWAN